MGKMLVVDLSVGSLEDLPISIDQCERFLGGYGVGADFIYHNQKAGISPFSEDSILGFVTGPLTGTPAISATRFTVVGKSPLTNGWGDANCGGYFGNELKRAGYDMVFIKGVSHQPVSLIIINNKAQLILAEDKWGKATRQTEIEYKEQFGEKSQVACIGPAGENLSLISGIVCNGRLAARSGLGAVMGSKHLKAIVAQGNCSIALSNPKQAEFLRRELLGKIGGPWVEVWKKYGTAGALSTAVEMGDSPVKNWGGSIIDFPNSQKISDEKVIERQLKRYGCWHCPIACGGIISNSHDSIELRTRKPEYETLSSFGPLILNDNLDDIVKMNVICDQAGLDTISAGSVIAFAIEIFENKLITVSDTDGLILKWGNGDSAIQLLKKIIKREGIGDILADGVARASEKIGQSSENFAMHIGKQELPMHDPRLTMPYLMGYLLDATPSRHNQGSAGFIDMPRSWTELAGAGLFSVDGFEDKTDDQFKLTNLVHTINTSGLCIFGVSSFMDRFILPEFLEAIVGWKLTPEELVKIGERIGALRIAFNFREGLESQKWKTPDRILGKPPLQNGPLAGKQLNIENEIRAFRTRSGWDPISGKPTQEKLLELGLEHVIQDIW